MSEKCRVLKEGSWVLDLKDPQNHEAWETFVQKYQLYIYAILKANGVQASDIDDHYQIILMRCLEKIDSFRYDLNELGLRRWLKTMIVHEAYNLHRRNKMIREKLEAYPWIQEVKQELGGSKVDQEDIEVLSRAWKRAESHFQKTHLLVFKALLEGESVEQLAKRFGLKKAGIYTIKQRMKKKLRQWCSESLK